MTSVKSGLSRRVEFGPRRFDPFLSKVSKASRTEALLNDGDPSFFFISFQCFVNSCVGLLVVVTSGDLCCLGGALDVVGLLVTSSGETVGSEHGISSIGLEDVEQLREELICLGANVEMGGFFAFNASGNRVCLDSPHLCNIGNGLIDLKNAAMLGFFNPKESNRDRCFICFIFLTLLGGFESLAQFCLKGCVDRGDSILF